MAERDTAGGQLERILFLLPLASRAGGVPLREAADLLEVPVETLQRDIEAVTERAFYLPPGSVGDFQISLEGERLCVFAGGKFTRPPKLSQREALALSLGLRAAAADGAADTRQRLLDLAHRIDLELATASAEGALERFSVEEDDLEGEGLRALLEGAAVERCRCRLGYLKPDDADPTERVVDPYRVVYASGGWFVIGYCHERGGVRVFRVDRILEASVTPDTFEAPASFDPADHVKGGRVFRSDAQDDVRVRYSARIAPWIREHGPCEELADGAVEVGFQAADPGWAVRHALQYGPDAEVLAPRDVRERMVEALGAIVA